MIWIAAEFEDDTAKRGIITNDPDELDEWLASAAPVFDTEKGRPPKTGKFTAIFTKKGNKVGQDTIAFIKRTLATGAITWTGNLAPEVH